jgi:chlorobactene glucosyltransferase
MPKLVQRRRHGAQLIVAASIAQILSSVEPVRIFLVNVFGFGIVRLLSVAVGLVILLGYVLLFTWVARTYLLKAATLRARWVALASMLLVPPLVAVNFFVLPAGGQQEILIDKAMTRWLGKFGMSEAVTGGMHAQLSEPDGSTQVWTTAQVFAALSEAPGSLTDDWHRTLVRGLAFIENSRRNDGEKKEQGWAYYNDDQLVVTEVNAWVALSKILLLERLRREEQHDVPLAADLELSIARDLSALASRQSSDGGWGHLATSSQGQTRTYTSVLSLWAFVEASRAVNLNDRVKELCAFPVKRGVTWLLQGYQRGAGWPPNPNRDNPALYYPGLTAHVLYVLSRAEGIVPEIREDPIYRSAIEEFISNNLTERSVLVNEQVPDRDQRVSGTIFRAEGSTFLWFPWALCAYSELLGSQVIDSARRDEVRENINRLLERIDPELDHLGVNGVYEIAENSFCAARARSALSVSPRFSEAISRLARELPGNQRESAALPVVVVFLALLLIYVGVRVSLWRWTAPRLSQSSNSPELCTVLLPVRDEELNIEECVRSLLNQRHSLRIVIIDDSSSDSTLSIAKRLASEDDRVSVMQAPELPHGWLGKVHALSCGLESVATPWLLSTDADTRHEPNLLGRAIATAVDRKLDSLSISGLQLSRGFGEHLFTPAVFGLLDALLGDWSEAADGATTIANGQFILVRTDFLRSSGGFAPLKKEAVDDVALAKQVVAHGGRHGFFLAPDLLRIRMYRGFRAAFLGWRRIFGGWLGRETSTVFYITGLLLLPFLVMSVALVMGDMVSAAALWFSGVVAGVFLRKSGGHGGFWGVLFPLDGALVGLCVLLGYLDSRRGRLAKWKGREIRVSK